MVMAIDQKPMTPKALESLLRSMAPCESSDPAVRDAYERTLRQWVGTPAWQRDVQGFAKEWFGELTSVL